MAGAQHRHGFTARWPVEVSAAERPTCFADDAGINGRPRNGTIECVEANASPRPCFPTLLNVSFAASISAAPLREATNVPYILYVMTRHQFVVTEQHSSPR